MRKSTMILGECRPSNNTQRHLRYSSSIALFALLLALGACGTPANTADAGEGEPDITDDADGQVTPDTTDDAADTQDTSVKKDTDAGDVGQSTCTVATDCTGNPDPCHVWQCNNGVCDGSHALAPAGTACDDGKACSAGDKCDSAGVCQAGTDPVYGKTSDGKVNTCLTCTCANNPDGTCAVVTTDNGAPCDDGNNCTTNDLCGAGGTCKGAPKLCDSATNICYFNTCDPATGACAKQTNTASEGLGCDDGNACTSDEKCSGQDCTNGAAVICDSKSPCVTDKCDKVLGCITIPVNIPAGTTVACDDNDACTTSDKCGNGKCKGTSTVDSLPVQSCKVPKCDPANGNVSYVPADDNTTCDDGDACTKGDVCNQQICSGSPLICNDSNPCTDDACDPTKCSPGLGSELICGQCTAPVKVDGSPCDDGDKCTSGDGCNQGKCAGLPVDCDDKNVCTNDSCLPGSGCLHVQVAAATFCNDGDKCTTVDKCIGAICKGTVKDCLDTDPCTADACDPTLPDTANCTHTKFDGPCDDGDNCTNNDLCAGGKCAGSKVDCNDGNPCTNDLCDSLKKCLHIPLPGGTKCEDGLGCTQNDYCDAGKCTQLPADNKCVTCASNADCAQYNDQDICNGTIKCVDSYKGKVCDTDQATVIKCDATQDNACTQNKCNPDTGVCGLVKFNAGTFCTGNKCLDNAQCDGLGSCKGVAKDCDDKNICTVDSCDPTFGCKHTNATDGGACNDGSKCTPIDTCLAGKCVGNTNTCGCVKDADCAGQDDGDLCNGVLTCQNKLCQADASTVVNCAKLANTCQDNVCTPLTGKCSPVSKADFIACDDSDACTLGETCSGGVCSSTKFANCDDKNPCTADYCDPVFGCDHAPMATGGLCDDGNACTTKDVCKSGICAGTTLVCDDSNQCTIDTCSKTKGCAHTLDDTLSCTDGDPCSAPDHCSDGVCISTPMNCDDNNACTIDACDGNGGCKNIFFAGKDCDDGNACTIQDSCVIDKCVGKPKACDDSNPCTADVCKAGTCLFTAQAGLPCTDANECTGPDLCTGNGECIGAPVDCSTGTVCKTNLECLPLSGCHTVQNDGALCDDGDFCTSGNAPGTLGDVCKGGGCSGVALNCDDKNICTNDVCDKNKGCLITQNLCDDANSCTVDSCDQVLGCQHATVNGGFCDDGDACTEKTTCDTGSCVGGQAVNCDDKNACSTDTCDKTAGCGHVALADGATCTDNDVCTADGCVGGACVGVALNCDDGNPCTNDICNPISGCVHTDVTEGAPCDDGESCTTGTVCQSGSCGGGNLDLCSAWCPGGTDAECKWLDPNGNSCDGTYRCVASKVLQKNVCKFDPTVVACDSTGDGPCLHNTCDPQDGSCKMTQSLNGVFCEDGKGCTVSDTCYNGICKGGPTNDCAVAKDACNGATCVEDPNAVKGFKCVALPLDDTISCDADQNGCTTGDHCSAGKCISGTAVNCAGVAGNCEVSTCASLSSTGFNCIVSKAADNAPCDDGKLCSVGDFCKNGTCQAGTGSYDCSALTGVCAIGVCDKTANNGLGACIPSPQNTDMPCDADGNGCTQGDKCVAGTCVPGVPPDCLAKTTDCATGACKQSGPSTYTCVGAPKANNLPCEADNDGCTVGDSCYAGACAPGPTRDCSSYTSNGGCTVGSCVSLSNASNYCQGVPAGAGIPCDADGNGCTVSDACNAYGGCEVGLTKDCNASTDQCKTGGCVSLTSQTYQCGDKFKPNGTVCDADSNGCTQNDACLAGVCTAGATVSCGTSTNQCTQKKCFANGPDKYICTEVSLAQDTPCDADGNGCTMNDGCFSGTCAPGLTQTCATFASQCNTVACASTGSSSYNCKATATTSYGPLNPEVTCVSTANPTTCPTGYLCAETDPTTHAGHCLASVTLSCDDNNACTSGDYCSGGTCIGGAAPNCDDADLCTADSCDAKTSGCVHTAIAGCGKCLNETFSGAASTNLAVRSSAPTVTTWAYAAGAYQLTFDATTWKDPTAGGSDYASRLVARKLYLQSTGPSQLEFDLNITGGSTDCSTGMVDIVINDAVTKSVCQTTTTNTHVIVDLSAWSGAPVDIQFVGRVGTTKPTTAFLAVLDNLTVVGNCSTSCVGVDFEPRAADGTSSYVMPQAWRTVTTDSTYVSWGTSSAAGHTGSSELVASWTGKPASGTPQIAKLTIPQVSVVTGNTLYLATKTSFGDLACGADDLSVRVNKPDATTVELFKQCGNTSGWNVSSYDLSQFANTTVDIDIVVTSGTGAGAKGTVEIDDIAIGGACTYLCLSDDFETGGLSKWSVGTTDSVSKLKPFAASTSFPTSGVTTAFAQFDTNSTDNKMAFMTGNPAKGMMVQLPVLGATLTAQLNLFSATPPADCGTKSTSAVFWMRLWPLGPSLGQANTPATLATAPSDPLADWLCNSTSGTYKYTHAVLPTAGANIATPGAYIIKQPATTTGKMYIDDFQIICQ